MTVARGVCRAVALLTATAAVVGRLMPVDDRWSVAYRRDGPTVIDVCRMTALDLAQQPFAMSVVALGPTPDGFLSAAHDLVGTAVLMHAPAVNRGPEDARDAAAAADSDGRAVLVIVEGQPVDAVLGLIDDGAVAAAWNQKSHYVVWLIRPDAIERSAVKTLFRAAWQRKSVANVVIIAYEAAFTYNPFRNVVTERPVDAAGLRAVGRSRMTDLNGHPVRICMFPKRLKAVKLPDGSYGGMDGIVAATVAKHMNFTPIYSEPSDGGKYGWAEANSESVGSESHVAAANDTGTDSNFTYTGLLGDLVYNKVDMAFNGVFLDVIISPCIIYTRVRVISL